MPIAGDVTEESMLDLIPLACPWREVTQFDLEADLIRESLEFPPPQACSRAVAAAAVRSDQQPLCR